MLAERRKSEFGKIGREKQLNRDTPVSADAQPKGEARDIVAKKVGLKSGHEVDRAINGIPEWNIIPISLTIGTG